MKKLKNVLMIILTLSVTGVLSAQIPGTRIPPREDDHFQRWLTVSRIDLSEKINEPLVATTDMSIYSSSKFGENNGMIAALMNGLKSGKYLAYSADTLGKSITWEQAKALYDRQNGVIEDFPEGEENIWEEEEYLYDDESMEENEGDVFFEGDGETASESAMTMAPYEAVVEIIENKIFDKNRSDIVHDIQYIRLVWVDPGETLPDKNYICFKYSDVIDVLEDTKWANKYNDAEHRNIREIFEERIYDGYVINVSGKGVMSLGEAEYRSQQMTEFEHHLWSY